MFTIQSRSETESLLHEKFQAILVELDTIGDNASHGHVLDDMDDFLFTAIRNLGNETLQHKLQERINSVEKQPEAKQCPHCKKTQVHNKKEKTFTSSNGHFQVHFHRCRCPHCHQSSYPVMPIVGLDNNYTRGARRLIAFDDGNYSDRKAAELLKEFGCFTLSHVTVGKTNSGQG
jgi:hypothetical protein